MASAPASTVGLAIISRLKLSVIGVAQGAMACAVREITIVLPAAISCELG